MTALIASAPGKADYGVAMRAMHWASASLLVGSYATAWAISDATSSAEASKLLVLHRSCGLVILTLTAIRAIWRQRTRVPELPPDVPLLQRVAARANVVGLYTLLVVQPLSGATASMLYGDRLTLLGFVLPNVLPLNHKLADVTFAVHGTVGWLLLGLIGLHAAAAFYHHFVRRDDVLARMLPVIRRRSGPVGPSAAASR